MKTDGKNTIAQPMGYRHLNSSCDKIPSIKDKQKVVRIIMNTIPIASVGPANKGKI